MGWTSITNDLSIEPLILYLAAILFLRKPFHRQKSLWKVN